MERRSVRHNIFRIVLAVLFVSFGLVALGNNLGWWNIDDLFLEWWPMIIILVGLITIFSPGGSWGGGIFLIFLGVLFLLHSQGIYDISDLIWPAMLMMVGVIIWPRKRRLPDSNSQSGGATNGQYHTTNEDHVFNINTLFNSRREAIRDDQLAGGHGTAVFGNLDLDLRQVKPREGAYLEVTAVFGNVSLLLPPDWKVVKHGGPVFGKIEDHRPGNAESGFTKSVSIEMNAVFGRVDIMN